MAVSQPASELDFLGEGTNDLPNAPAETEEQRRRRKAAADQRALDATLADIPYGSSRSPTAGQYQVTTQPAGGLFKSDSSVVHRINPDGTKTVVADYSDTQPYDPKNPGASVGVTGGSPGAHTLQDVLGDGETSSVGDIAADAGVRSDEGNRDRSNALQGIIDRFDAAKASFDTGAQDQSRQAQRTAIGQNQELFTRAINFDPDAAAARASEEALSRSLAIARSAPGGASRASALMNALQAQPSIQAEATRAAQAEGRQQQNVALQAAGQLGQLATQTRGQDEAQAEAITGIGLDVAKSIANFTGLDLQLDQRDREFLGEVALQVANLNLDIEKLGVDESLRQLELQLAREGLEQEWRLFKESQKITGKDILGGIFSLGGGVVSGLFTGLAAKK